MPEDAPMNMGALDPDPLVAWSRVSGMQTKLHHWAAADPGRRFDDLFNFVYNPTTLIVTFDRVAGNSGANTPGVDGLTAHDVESRIGMPGFLSDLRAQLKSGSFRPLAVRERRIPKPGGSGKARRQGRVRGEQPKRHHRPDWGLAQRIALVTGPARLGSEIVEANGVVRPRRAQARTFQVARC